MQKNYLLFIIDSLNYSHVKESKIELMPFMEQLKREGVYCESMYSQAPYTEAAVMNLYCGQDVLQHGGYLYRFKDAPVTLFEAMQEKGYVTYYNSYQPQCHPSSVRRGIDYLYYNVGYDLGALWSYRLEHYSEELKKGKLTREDYCTLQEIFNDNFNEWLRFLDDLISGNESANMIQNNALNYDADTVKKSVENEYRQYEKQPEKYIEEVLLQGVNHSLFAIPAYVQDGKIQDRRKMEEIRNLFQPLFKRIKIKNFWLNFRNCRGIFRGTFKKMVLFMRRPNKNTFKEFLKSCYLSVNQLLDLDLFQRIENRYDRFKNAPSGRTHIDHYIKWASEHREDGAHFACIHIDDIHNPEIFFTYDSADMDLLKSEFAEAEKLLSELPKDYFGNITHELSLRYMDNILKYLYEQMHENGMLENTCIAVCADHGFSFGGNPLRDSFVINLFLENYNIPCVITGTGLEPGVITALRTSKDIPATICDLIDGEIPKEFTGHSVFEKYEYKNVYIEYCGGGCPDLSRREIKLAAFDKEYLVGSLCKLNEPMAMEKVTEIYDLEKDPKQLKNLAYNEYDKTKVKELLEAIETRKNDIVNSRVNRG